MTRQWLRWGFWVRLCLCTPTRADPPPPKWSDLRYVFDSQEGHDGKEALQG
jgi:hypothetical protein